MTAVDQVITEQDQLQRFEESTFEGVRHRARRMLDSLGGAALVAVLAALPGAPDAEAAEGDFAITAKLNSWGRVELHWPNSTNTAYQVQRQNTVGDVWNNLIYVSGDGRAPSLTFTDEYPGLSSSQYYRVVADNAPTNIVNLQRALDTQRVKALVNGAWAAVISTNYTWIGTSGLSDPATTNYVAPNDRLIMASCTKMFTAAYILKLQEKGKLSIKDTIGKWLPDFNHPNITNTITIEQLLKHTSGIQDWWNSGVFPKPWLDDLTKVWTPEDTLALVQKPNFKPGTSWGYSNMGPIVAGMIAEKAGGEPIEQAFRGYFFEPLDLPSIWLRALEKPTGDIAHGFSGYPSPPRDISADPDTAVYSSSFTAAGLMTSLLDIARWTQLLYREGKILNADSMKQMTNFMTAPGYGRAGLGTLELSTSKGPAIGHLGDGWGGRMIAVYIPRDNVTIVVATNTEKGKDPTHWERFYSFFQAMVTAYKPEPAVGEIAVRTGTESMETPQAPLFKSGPGQDPDWLESR